MQFIKSGAFAPFCSVFCLLLFITNCLSAQDEFHVIEKGVIKGDFKITLVNKNISMLPNQFFSIKDYGLVTNNPGSFGILTSSGYEIKRVKSYEITIERLSDHTIFYGRIAFYTVLNAREVLKKDIAKSYNIAIPSKHFSKVLEGKTSCCYEYYHTIKYGARKFPTWVIWFSNTPIGENIPDGVRRTDPDSSKRVMYRGRNNFTASVGYYNLNYRTISAPIEEQVYPDRGTAILNSTASVKQIPPLFIKYEIGLAKWFSLGMSASYHKISATYKYLKNTDALVPNYTRGQEKLNYESFGISTRAIFHFAVGKHFEMFSGCGLAFNYMTTIIEGGTPDAHGKSPTYAQERNNVFDYNNRYSDPFYYIYNPDAKNGQYPINYKGGYASWNYLTIDLNMGVRGYITRNIGVDIELSVFKALVQVGIIAGF